MKTYTLVLISILILIYFITAFITLEANPLSWDESTRAGSSIAIVLSFILCYIYSLLFDVVNNK